jgi:septum formation protein
MTITPDVNEKLSIDKLSDSPIKMAEMWAKEQSASVLNKIRNFATPINSAFIVTTNQIVLYEGQMMKYPVNREEAIKWLSSYSSDKVSIVTAVVVTHYPSERQACDTDIAIIHFYDISPDVVNSISNRPETLKFIGAISIEDTDLNPLIRHVEGTVDSIAGMPVDVISRLILNVAQEYTPSSPRIFTFRDPVIDSAKSSIRSTVDTTTTQQSSSTSTLTASISIPPTSNTKWLTVICPGKKVPIRSSSSITSHVLRYASSGDKFQIYRQTVSGFYQLCDDKVR